MTMGGIIYGQILLRALTEMRRHHIVTAAANPETAYLYPPAFVYAVLNSVYPVFHEGLHHAYLDDPQVDVVKFRAFSGSYSLGQEQVNGMVGLMMAKSKKPDLSEAFWEKFIRTLSPKQDITADWSLT
jgi:hypothetical protein